MELLRSSLVARCALAVALCALAAALSTLAIVLTKLLTAQQQQQQQQQPPALMRSPPQQQNYAQLVLKLREDSSIVPRRTLDWYTHSVKGAFLGMGFAYNNNSKTLVVKMAGLYCIYVQINLTHHLDKGNIMNANVTIDHQTDSSFGSSRMLLNLPLHRVYNSSKTLHNFKAVLHRLAENDALNVIIRADSKQKASLVPRGSFFGLFQVHET